MAHYSVLEVLGDEPITVEEVRERLHALPGNANEQQYTIQPLIVAAREFCEGIAGYAFIQQRIAAHPDASELASGVINLPRPPVIEIESVTLHGADGTDSETDDYELDGEEARLYLPGVQIAQLRRMNPVTIVYVAGAETCPELARQAMHLLIGHWYQNRESVQTGAVAAVEIEQTTRAILRQYKRWW